MTIDLKDKVAIVTGAGRGIGREIAMILGREGVKTVVTDVDRDNLDSIGADFEAESLTGSRYPCDVRNFSQIKEMADDIVKKYGRIDILVNNAGVAPTGPADDYSEKDWDDTMDVNLKGTFLMCKAVIPVMKKQKSGRIINASSFAAIVPRVGTVAYASSKAGVVYLTRVLAGELGPWNITVNSYAPGMVPTEMNHYAEQSDEMKLRNMEMLTLRRWGSKNDIGNLICFLASDLASYITGTLIDVSGGKLATQVPREPYEWPDAPRS